MGLSYHFRFKAPARKSAAKLEQFLRVVEGEAKRLGFAPTMVLNAVFQTPDQRAFSRRLTSGLPLEDVRLKAANFPDGRVWSFNRAAGSCRVPPSSGVLLIVTNEQGEETAMGFLRFPDQIEDDKGRVVARTGLGKAWAFRNFLDSPDLRYRALVRKFAEAGYLHSEIDEFVPKIPGSR